jgi:hypothetical protein
MSIRGGLPMPPPLNSPLQGTAGSAPLVSGLRPVVFHPLPSSGTLLQQQAMVNGTIPLAGAETSRSPAGRCAGFAYMSDMIDMSAMPTPRSAHAAAALAANSPSLLQGERVLHMQHGGPAYSSSPAHQGAGAPGVADLPYSVSAMPTPAYAAPGAAANLPASSSVPLCGEVSHMQHEGRPSEPAAAAASAEALNHAAAVTAAAEAILRADTDADRERILLNTVASSRDICFRLGRLVGDPRRICAAINAVNRITAAKFVPPCFLPQAPVQPASSLDPRAPSPIPTSLQLDPSFLAQSLHPLPAAGATTAAPLGAAGRASASPAVKVPSCATKVQSGTLILELYFCLMLSPSSLPTRSAYSNLHTLPCMLHHPHPCMLMEMVMPL